MVIKCLIKNVEGRKLLSVFFFGASHTLSYAPELQRPGVLHCLSMSVHSADLLQADQSRATCGAGEDRQEKLAGLNKVAADAVINHIQQLCWHPNISIALTC